MELEASTDFRAEFLMLNSELCVSTTAGLKENVVLASNLLPLSLLPEALENRWHISGEFCRQTHTARYHFALSGRTRDPK